MALLLVGAPALALAGNAVSGALVRAGVVGDAAGALWRVLQWPVLAGAGLAAFLLPYRYAPVAAEGWRALWPGAMFALVLWLVFSAAFSRYAVPRSDPAYWALAGVVVLMLYIYHSALVLLTGAELNRVMARRRGARNA